MKTVITFGTFDLFHIGHLNILENCKKLGDHLIVGVSSDEFNFSKKQKYPVIKLADRMKLISAIKYVDEVFIEEKIDKKDYCTKYKADIFVIGDDWKGKKCGLNNLTFDEQLKDVCEVYYLPRTQYVSTTEIIEKIQR